MVVSKLHKLHGMGRDGKLPLLVLTARQTKALAIVYLFLMFTLLCKGVTVLSYNQRLNIMIISYGLMQIQEHGVVFDYLHKRKSTLMYYLPQLGLELRHRQILKQRKH